MFNREDVYRAVKEAGFLNVEKVASLFDLPKEEVVWCGFSDQARAFKVTIPRRRMDKNVAAGGFMEYDVHGSQQYLPLMQVQIPEGLLATLRPIVDGRI